MTHRVTIKYLLAVIYVAFGFLGPISMGAESAVRAGDLAVLGEGLVEGDFQPYVGKITGEKVNLRSGPARAYYASAQLSEGQLVLVYGVEGAWAKVAPTPQCFSYVSKEYVRLQALDGSLILPAGVADELAEATEVAEGTDGVSVAAGDALEGAAEGEAEVDVAIDEAVRSQAALIDEVVGRRMVRGVVTGDRVRVRAGSLTVPPDNANQVQAYLSEGDVVRVVGQRDGYYKVVCPRKAYFWVSRDYVAREGALTAEVEQEMRSQASLAVFEGDGEGDVSADVIDELAKDKAEYRALTALLAEEKDKPLDEQNPGAIRGRLDALMAGTTFPSIKASGAALDRQLTRMETAYDIWRRSAEQTEKLEETLAKIDEKRQVAAAIDDPPGKQVDEIVIKGRLAPSAVFTAAKGNARYLVLDEDELIQCYAVSSAGRLDLSRWVGQHVGLVGRAHYDAYSGIRVLQVSSVVKFADQE